MYFQNKKAALEYEISDRKMMNTTDGDNAEKLIEKMNESSYLAGWPFIPLLNFEKEAYKNDEVYNTNKLGDDPLELMRESTEKDIIKNSEVIAQLVEEKNILMTTNGNNTNENQTTGFFSDKSFNPIELFWENLTIFATYKEKKKRCPPCSGVMKTKMILNNVTGIARPGTFTAIIGPSGSGKTTLLNFLSSRMMSGNLSFSGNLMINGHSVESIEKIGNQVAYVMQDDILLATFTPIEAFTFCAELRMNASPETKKQKVDSLIKLLGLSSCANTVIGNTIIRGISGGERKRTSIGVELLTNPSLIFLDEPTTGLDSETSLHIIKLIGNLAKNGRTVISTIHQPSSDIFSNFNKLILLCEGNVIYQGDARNSLAYFTNMGYKPPQFCNPATFFMKCMNPEGLLVANIEKTHDYGIKLTDEIKNEFKIRLKQMIDTYKNSDDFNKNLIPTTAEPVKFDHHMNTVSWFKQFAKIFERGFRNEIRNPIDVKMKIITSIFFALVNIIVFEGLGHYRAEVQNRTGCLFLITMTMCFGSIFANLMTFSLERPLFVREKMNRTYTLSAYFWGRTSCELPFHFLYPTMSVCISYHAVGLSDVNVSKIFILIFIQNVNYFCGVSFGFFLSAIFPQPEMAMAMIPVFIIPLLVMAGFFVNQNSIPYFFYEFEYLSNFKYSFQASFLNEFSDKNWYCSPGVPCNPIREMNFAEDMWTCIWALFLIGVGFRFMACLYMVKLTSPKRPKLIKDKKSNKIGV